MHDQVLKTKHSALQIDNPPNILKQMITYRDKHWYNTGKMFHIMWSLIKPFTKKSPPYNSYSTSHKGASYLNLICLNHYFFLLMHTQLPFSISFFQVAHHCITATCQC